jgi:hypothetical protein
LIPHEYGVNTYGIPSKFIDSGTGDLNEEILLATRTKEILEFISKNMAVA